MRVNGIGAMSGIAGVGGIGIPSDSNAAGGLSGARHSGQGEDAVARELQQRIENTKKQIQELGDDERLSPEEKQKKKRELSQEISELEAELRQHELEQRRGREREAAEKSDELLGGSRAKNADNDTSEISPEGMQAFIAADSTMKLADAQGSVRAALDGHAGVLEGEIAMDKGRGAGTEKKEAELAAIRQRSDAIGREQGKRLAEVNDKKLL